MKAFSSALRVAACLWIPVSCFAYDVTLTFDDLPVSLQPTEHYSRFGVHFRAGIPSASVEPGVSNGDPNGWGVNGTVGPYFLGFPYGSGMTMAFDTPISSFSIDAIRPAGLGDVSFTIWARYQGNYLGPQTVNLREGGPWTNLVFNALLFDEVYWSIGGGGRYAVDNIRFNRAPGSGPPVIFASPYDQNAYIGSELALSVRAGGQQPLFFQWYFESAPLTNETNSTLWIPSVQTNHTGRYFVTVSNSLGVRTSYTNTFIAIPSAPIITSGPFDQAAYVDGYAFLYVNVTGFPFPTFQWQFNGTNIPGATESYLQLFQLRLDQAGPYRVIASNASGSVTSQVATLTVLTLPPSFDWQPSSQTVSEGSHVQFRVYGYGAPGPTYQWYFNGAPIVGETKTKLKLYNVSSNNAGVFTIVASNIAGVTTSDEAVLSIVRPNSLDSWEWRNPLPQGNELSGAVYANNRFVAVGRFGAIVTSPDGSNWTSRASQTRNHLYSIAYGNGRFVAVGSAGEILTSTDGITWTREGSGTPRNLYAVCYTNNQFIAVGRFGTILTSANGTSWSARNSGTSNHLRGVAYGMGKYVAVGSVGEIVTSADGVTWTKQVAPLTNNLRGVCFGNGTFMAVGNNGFTIQSTNGVDWVLTTYSYIGLRAISFVNGTFITVGRAGYVYTSSDGVAWTFDYTPYYSGLYDIVRGPGNFLAVGDQGALLIASNSSQWVDQRLNAGVYFRDAAYGGGKFVAVGQGPYGSTFSNVWVSADGRDGTFSTVDPNISLNAITYGQGTFVVGAYEYSCCSGTNRVWSSTSGSNWSPSVIDVPNVSGLAYGNGRFIGVGGGTLYTNGYYTNTPNVILSSNGQNWTSAYVGNSSSLQFAAVGNGVFVAANYYSIYASSNGVDWTAARTNQAGYYNGLAYGNGIFVVAGLNYVSVLERFVLTSTDGLTWAQHPLPVDVYPNAVKWVNGFFVIIGGKGQLLTSQDGVNWVRRNLAAQTWLASVAYGQRTYVAVGQDGSILRAGELAFEFPAHGFVSNEFELIFNGELGRVYRVQYSTDLQQWFNLASVTNTQPRMTFRDSGASGQSRRFYRLVTP